MNGKYMVRWDSWSENAADSMPLGGCDMGCNVWVEDGRIMIYASESGAFDENGTMLKLTRLRVDVPGVDMGRGFSQTLYPVEGCIVINADGAEFTLWCDTERPRLHIEYSGRALKPEIRMDCWRWRDREVTRDELGQCRDFLSFHDAAPVTRADSISAQGDEILFSHRNSGANVFDRLIAQQKLEGIRGLYRDVLTGRVSGGLLRAPGFEYAGTEKWQYQTTDCMSHIMRAQTGMGNWQATLTACCEQCADWEGTLRARAEAPCDRQSVRSWWNERFERSFIDIDPDKPGSTGWRIARNYALYRYMQLCNARGQFPTKFNGGLFTFDEGHTPDYRNWGGTEFTAQNQRLVSWPMLRNGDFDAMKPQFEFYRLITAAQKALTRAECGHGGAFFDEQINVFGMACAAEYELPWAPRRAGIAVWDQDNPWIRLHFSTALEISLMILQYKKYCGGDIAPYMDFIDASVRFYFEHYPRRADGTLHIFPSTALETYKGADPKAADADFYGAGDPMDAVAGLRCVLDELIALGGAHADEYRKMRAICPELPTGERDGVRVFEPAAEYVQPPFNCELPQLYRVFPFSPDGLSADEITLGRNAWEHTIDNPDQLLHVSWHQCGIFAARLGMGDVALDYLKRKLDDSQRRFPAFWGPGHDWSPDHNWGGSGCIGLQEMLMCTDGGEIKLFPCWPREWDAHFKLYAPDGRCVEAEMRGGKITRK